jgi:DHA1 family inner membrane transport protein
MPFPDEDIGTGLAQARRGTGHAEAAVYALAAASFLYVTAELIPVGLLQQVAWDLGVSQSAVGRLVTAYGFVVVVASLPLTHAMRNVPRRRLFIGLLAVYAVSTAGAALSRSYETLLAFRLATSTSQALFWSIVVPTAAGLAPSAARGRAIGTIFGGSSLAVVLGVPAGTWLGQHAGWRAVLAVLAILGAVTLLALATSLPDRAVDVDEHPRGTRPSARRYRQVIIATILSVTGAFAFLTYIGPYLTDVARFAEASIGPALLLRGLAAVAGVAIGGWLIDHTRAAAIPGALTLQAIALLLLAVAVPEPIVVLACVAATGLAFAILTTALANEVLAVAPGRVELASSGASIAVNVGITAGSLLGSELLITHGAAGITLSAAMISIAALPFSLARSPTATDR